MKLTDTQLVILSAASQREDRGVILPANLKGGAAQKVVLKLIEAGLLEEVRARGTLPVWRRSEEEGAFALRITRPGMKAIWAEEDGAAKEPSSEPESTVIKAPRQRVVHRAAAKKPDRVVSPGPSGSKLARVTEMLRRPAGATIDELMAATNWLPHSTRAALSGLRKGGHSVERDRTEDGRTRYRITDGANAKRRSA